MYRLLAVEAAGTASVLELCSCICCYAQAVAGLRLGLEAVN
jgi:hypothetical protein